jgi:membrane protease YdiL (CAAX protease family)
VADLDAIVPLAGLAFAWGLGKGLFYGGYLSSTCGCPMCVDGMVKAIANPKRFVTHNLLGPVTEEVSFRATLQPRLGLFQTSALFGALHFSPLRYGVLANAFRVADAILGGILYGTAFDRSGIGASSLCHSLHNFGADLGLLVSVGQGLTK